MYETDGTQASNLINTAETEHFRKIRWLTNHWARPIGPRSYYWYLTFENCVRLHSFVSRWQTAIAFPYYDLIPLSDLHLSVDRIALHGDVTLTQLSAIEAAAENYCREIPPLNITFSALSGTSGAIGFTASPVQPIRELRDTLRTVTLSVYPDAPIKHSEFNPHVAIAYANADNIPAVEVISVAEELNDLGGVDVSIAEAVIVLLERRQRAYSWEVVSRIQLTG
jgi:hypothetical protein